MVHTNNMVLRNSYLVNTYGASTRNLCVNWWKASRWKASWCKGVALASLHVQELWKRSSDSSFNGFSFAFENSLSPLDCVCVCVLLFCFRKSYHPNSLVSLPFLSVSFSSLAKRTNYTRTCLFNRHVRIQLYASAAVFVILCLCLRTCKWALTLHAKIITFQNWQISCSLTSTNFWNCAIINS